MNRLHPLLSLLLAIPAMSAEPTLPADSLRPMEQTTLGEATVTTTRRDRVRRSAYSAVVADTRALQYRNLSLGQTLGTLPGLRLRQSGGVGSDSHLLIDGFGGRHVRIFVDGVPHEGSGTAMSLNNLPVDYAERVEVYKGVVPVTFGADAIGGVINVVTAQDNRPFALDAAYTYGSFNTHKSHLRLLRRTAGGWTFALTAFQNYSDNDYRIDNWVRTFTVNDDGTVTRHPVDQSDVRRVRRFNDTFHNEALTARAGLTGTSWADRLWVTMTASQYYKEIQTGVYQDIVFGQKHRHGYSLSPAIDYSKRRIGGVLDVSLHADYTRNLTTNVDTAARYYNWLGDYYVTATQGEQSYQHAQQRNDAWNATAGLVWRPAHQHEMSLNHVYSAFRRTSRNYIGATATLTDYTIPKRSAKHITGLAWKVMPSARWNATVFAKHYAQSVRGAVSTSTDGVGNYEDRSHTVRIWGTGAALTWFPLDGLQAKASYERACRLPTYDELFGDEDLEAGRTDLRPEHSHNVNLDLAYTRRFGRHSLRAEGTLLYRDTKDFIKRGIGKRGALQYGIYENHGRVRTRGYSMALRYAYGQWLAAGLTYNNTDTRDNEPRYTGGSGQANVHYGDRLPNIPYRYAGGDLTLRWPGALGQGTSLALTYDTSWQHAFPLYWESIGHADTKSYVPEQWSHNVALTLGLGQGRWTFTLQCDNLTDARLYDNFSLQKPGRALYVKARVSL